MIVLAAVLLASLPGVSATASTEVAANCLGAYFDGAGRTTCLVPTPYEPFTVYWVLTDPAVATLGGYEFAWMIVPSPEITPFILEMVLPEGAINAGGVDNLLVRLPHGLMAASATVLARYSLMLVAPADPRTHLTGGPARPATLHGRALVRDHADPNRVVPMNFSTVDGEAVVVDDTGWVVPGLARLACPGPVEVEELSWSRVKALFR